MPQNIQLPKFKDCTGCMVCYDACQHQAITIKKNKRGFYQVHIDHEQCIECGICTRKCPIMHPPQISNYNPQAYIGWSLSETNLKESASGGIFIELAISFLKIYQKSVVYGASWEQDKEQVVHKYTDKICELTQFQNSKYLQSNTISVYKSVKNHLQQGYYVLFSGTPCQIAGLINYIPLNLKKHLYTIEIICHGVPSFDLLKSSKEFYQSERIKSFRTKNDGWRVSQKCTYQLSESKYVTPKKGNDIFYNMYLSEYFLRPSCTHCIFANLPRIADVTIGDYWGSNMNINTNDEGTSLFYINNKRMIDLVNTSNIHKQDINFINSLYVSSRITCNLYTHLEVIPKILWTKDFVKSKQGNILYKIYFKIWQKLLQRAQTKKNNKISQSIKFYENNRNHHHS